MAEPLVDITERAYDALNRRDLDGFLEFVDPDVVMISLIAEAEGGSYRGHDGVREWWHRVAGSMGELRFSNQGAQQLDDEKLLVNLHVAGEVNGVEIEQRMWHALVIRDGRGVWWQAFRTEEEGLAALREHDG